MNSLSKIVSSVSELLEFNQATLSGALDVIVVEHPDGSLCCNPFRVRFGKLKVLKSRSQKVVVTLNGTLSYLTMKLRSSGEAYFDFKQDLSPVFEETKLENLSPGRFSEISRARAEPLQPKKGDFCDDLTPDEDSQENEDSQELKVELSLCAHLWDSEPDKFLLFQRHLVPFEEFSHSPWAVLNNNTLLIKMGNKVYTKDEAIPLILSLIVYKKEISKVVNSQSRDQNSTLSSEQLRALNLKEGKNEVIYTVNSHLQGEQSVAGSIYLWKSSDKVIISDIDGTITKSDVIGHIFSMFGKDYNHPGIAKFYTQLSKNGYKILYLSSRAIGQVNVTRDFLFNLRQDGFVLPDGPLITSPDRLLKSFFREVIQKTPQEFKASALNEILELFPRGSKPFFAGFGNRDTDAIAYRTVGVDLEKIFIINTNGNIFVFNQNTYLNSYPEMCTVVSEIFPSVDFE